MHGDIIDIDIDMHGDIIDIDTIVEKLLQVERAALCAACMFWRGGRQAGRARSSALCVSVCTVQPVLQGGRHVMAWQGPAMMMESSRRPRSSDAARAMVV